MGHYIHKVTKMHFKVGDLKVNFNQSLVIFVENDVVINFLTYLYSGQELCFSEIPSKHTGLKKQTYKKTCWLPAVTTRGSKEAYCLLLYIHINIAV